MIPLQSTDHIFAHPHPCDRPGYRHLHDYPPLRRRDRCREHRQPWAWFNGNNVDISITRDIGIGAPGDFTGALAGDVGPFLRDPNGPYVESNPTTGALETYIGDPNLTTPVTIGGVLTAVPGTPVIGGPMGNILRIQGPPGSGVDVQTDLFTVSGKLFDATLPTPLVIERTDYTRALLGNFQTDLFATSAATATLSFTDAALNTTPMADLDANSEFHGEDSVNVPVPLSTIEVSASNPPGNLDTTDPSTLVDLVTISLASYSLGTNTLTVVASSSDEVGAPPLTLAETGDTGSGAASVPSRQPDLSRYHPPLLSYLRQRRQ